MTKIGHIETVTLNREIRANHLGVSIFNHILSSRFMKFKKEWFEKRWFAYSVSLCIVVIFYFLLKNIPFIAKGIGVFISFLSPVIYGLVIAYVLNPLVKLFERKVFCKVKNEHGRRNLSIFLSLVAIIAGIVLLLVALIPQIVKSVQTLIANMSTYIEGLQSLLSDLEKFAASKNVDISDATNMGDNLLNTLLGIIPSEPGNIINVSVDIGKGIFNGVISVILAIYFLADKKNMQAAFKRLMHAILTDKAYRAAGDFWYRCNNILIRYIVFDLLDGLIIGAVNWIFMLIAGLPYGAIISVVVGVTNLAPTFGPLVGAVIGGFILVLVNPWYALWFIIFTIILQTFDGYILKPKLFGGTLGVSGVWILVCIIVGGRMFGVAGILLAIPFAAIADFVYTDMLEKREKKLAEAKERKEAKTEPETEKSEQQEEKGNA